MPPSGQPLKGRPDRCSSPRRTSTPACRTERAESSARRNGHGRALLRGRSATAILGRSTWNSTARRYPSWIWTPTTAAARPERRFWRRLWPVQQAGRPRCPLGESGRNAGWRGWRSSSSIRRTAVPRIFILANLPAGITGQSQFVGGVRTLTLSGTGSVESYSQVLRQISYTHSTLSPTRAGRSQADPDRGHWRQRFHLAGQRQLRSAGARQRRDCQDYRPRRQFPGCTGRGGRSRGFTACRCHCSARPHNVAPHDD